MILKIHRLGYTETYLLVVYYLRHVVQGPLDPQQELFLKTFETIYVKWLFGTGGFYDKSFDLSGIDDFLHYPDMIRESPHFQRYLVELWRAVHDSSVLQLLTSDVCQPYVQEIRTVLPHRLWPVEELGFVDKYGGLWSRATDSKPIFDAHKRCLIVSPFAPLFEEQFQMGHLTKLWKDDARNMNGFEHLSGVRFPFCFMNNGPDNNFWETLDRIFAEIRDACEREEIDLVCLSCGSYGHILVDRIVTHLNISAVYFGNFLPRHFGIHFLLPDEPTPDIYVAENWILSCPPELQYERTDVRDIQRYFGRAEPTR